MTSPNLQLPFIAAGQAQKHVTVNESLLRLDALVQMCAVSATTGTQPATPDDGSLYILPTGKTGADWDAMAEGALAYYRDGAWEEIAPREGWRAFVRDTDGYLVFTGDAWADVREAIGAAGIADDNVFTGANTLPKPVMMASGAWTTAGWGKALELDKGALTFVSKGGGSYAWGWGVSGDAFYVLRSSADDASAGGVPVFSCSPSAFVFEGNAVFYGGASPLPSVDNAIDLGSASFRFGTLYAATGTINTSDARDKESFQAIPANVKRAVRRVLAEIGAFQWRDAVASKGAGAARLHIGVTAQAVRDAFIAEGADPERWALFCADPVMETVTTLPKRTIASRTWRSTPSSHCAERVRSSMKTARPSPGSAYVPISCNGSFSPCWRRDDKAQHVAA